MTDCSQCASLRTWVTASGPGGLVERIGQMLDLVGHGFDEVATSRWDRWSRTPREEITRDLLISGYTNLPVGSHPLPALRPGLQAELGLRARVRALDDL